MSQERVAILLVEDEKAHIELIQRAFEPHAKRFELEIASTLKQARQRIQHTLPNLVITDLILPDGQGIDLIAHTCEGLLYPVLVMTGHGDETMA